MKKPVSMWKTIGILFAALFLSSAPAHAQWAETLVNAKKGDEFKVEGKPLKDSKGSLYYHYSTDLDSDIKSYCGYTWANPDNDWIYANDNFLYPNNTYLKKDLITVAGSRTQTIPRRFEVKLLATGATEGWFSFSTQGSAVTLQFLCTKRDVRGAGLGLWMINRTIALAAEKMDSNSISLRILSHPAAVPFYNGLQLSCSQTGGKEKASSYTLNARRQPLPTLDRKAQCYRSNIINAGAENNRRIKYTDYCASADQYQKFLSLNDTLAQAQTAEGKTAVPAIEANCNVYQGKDIDPDAVKAEIYLYYQHIQGHEPH